MTGSCWDLAWFIIVACVLVIIVGLLCGEKW